MGQETGAQLDYYSSGGQRILSPRPPARTEAQEQQNWPGTSGLTIISDIAYNFASLYIVPTPLHWLPPIMNCTSEIGHEGVHIVSQRTLSASELNKICQALVEVGEFGQVRLIVKKGRLRFVEVLRSASVDDTGDDEAE